MDKSWLHTFTAPSPAYSAQKTQRPRRGSLLQQPADQEKAGTAVVSQISEEREYEDPWVTGPPPATLAKRAQSYSDFYDAATAYSRQYVKAQPNKKRSLGSIRQHTHAHTGAEISFNDSFASQEADILEYSHIRYHAYYEQLQLTQNHLDGLLYSTNETLSTLSSLSASFKAVEENTETFRQQCESLVNEQRRLTHLADAVDENMTYYTYLEPMTRRLNAPGAASLVKGKDFPDLLANLDNCLAYMEAHPKHMESATYRSKYRLLLTRALTLIRHYFTKSLGDIATDIIKRTQAGQLKETTQSALLFAKFRVPAPELKALGLEIHKRAKPTLEDVDMGREPEYMSLMRELYQSYSTTRGRLILPLVNRKMAELAASYQPGDLIGFARAGLAFMRGIALDEYELWFEWFEQGTEGGLYDFLESLMDPMYDYLRPRTIHETKLEKLCELCGMIQDRYAGASSESNDEDEAADSDEESSTHSPIGNGVRHSMHARKPLDFTSLIHPALEDAQTRLVFLALNALRDNIENYKPKAEDLESPKIPRVTPNGVKKGPVLSGVRDGTKSAPKANTGQPSVTGTQEDDEDFDDSLSILSRQVGLGGGDPSAVRPPSRRWYPTLRKSIWLLRRIYRLVNSSVFDDLAHRVVHSTIASLLFASGQIQKQKSEGASADAQLFTITHLLFLKQQIVAFDIEFVPPEVEFDFSSVTNTFYELRDRGALWNPASWLRLVSGAVGGGLLPRVVENMLDAKAELDGRLRSAINDLVSGYTSHITAPIDPVALAALKAHNAHAFDALKAIRTVRGLAEKNVPLLRDKLEEWVDDARVRETLVAAVRDQVVATYEDFFDTYSEDRGVKISKKGKGREDEIWGPEVFSDGMEKVFRVGEIVLAGEEDPDGHVSE